MARTKSIRLEDDLSDRLDALAALLDRPTSWVIKQAIESYLDEQSWQTGAVQKALADYRSGKAELVPHEEVMAQLERRWPDNFDLENAGDDDA
jgi:predicted transcriptional regulator